MAHNIYTGVHGVEEKIRRYSVSKPDGIIPHVYYSKPGPRIKKIIGLAKEGGIEVSLVDGRQLDNMCASLPPQSQDHRGIVLIVDGEEENARNIVALEEWVTVCPENATVVILDSITDPHNAGAIIRSCDQFAVDLVLFPERRGVKDIEQNEVIARTSAGSVAWVPISIVSNLVRTVQILKENGFWVYAADAGGSPLHKIDFAENKAVIMGSEGSGLSKLLQEQCDYTVSIPTSGKIDSLNVSVASGILLYEIYRRTL